MTAKVMASVTFTAFMALTVLTRSQDMTEPECSKHRFDSAFTPGDSCEDIYNENEQTHDKPGYYWILDGPALVYCGMNYTGSSCEEIYVNSISVTRQKSGYYRIDDMWVYCDMAAIAFSRGDLMLSCGDGGWKKIAGFNITAGDDCPSPWMKMSRNTMNGVNFCRSASNSGGCYSVNYSTSGVSYQRVCGRASGYQKGTPDAFRPGFVHNQNVDGYYVDGLSITHGSPRQHIWTYAIGITDSGSHLGNCPCATVRGRNPPDFVGSHYYCESGADSSANTNTYYFSDILWDGDGCSADNMCCSDPNVPWFYRQLSMTTQDYIEVRICSNFGFNDEAILITNLEIYIQ